MRWIKSDIAMCTATKSALLRLLNHEASAKHGRNAANRLFFARKTAGYSLSVRRTILTQVRRTIQKPGPYADP
jgi:hypothetical protein